MKKHSEAASETPVLSELLEDWQWCVDQRDTRVFDKLRNNVNRRACWWRGQTDDGRRWNRRGDEKDVFPWPGAADTRVHLVDLFVKTDAAMLMTIWRRNKIEVQGTEIGDSRRASHMTQLIRWLRYTQMTEYPSEARLLANYFLERGAAVQGIWWVRERQMGYETVTVPQLMSLAESGRKALEQGAPDLMPGIQNGQLAELGAILADPSRDEEAYIIADRLYPETKKAAIKRAIADLRDSGEARIPRPYVLIDRPKTCALALNEDIFLPPECFDIDSETSSMHMREQVTETTLKARVDSMGWDADWVAEMIDSQRGNMTDGLVGLTPRRTALGQTGQGRAVVSTERLFEVIHSNRRQYNLDGVPVITTTVWSPGLVAKSARRRKEQAYASHEELTYDHGGMPAVLYRRELRSRNIDDSRGVGEIAGTWEDGIKAEIDSSRDRNSLNTVPPSYHPVGRPPEQWGPGAQLGTQNPERYGFFKGVGWDVGSRESRDVLANLADRYFGRPLKDGSNQLEANWITQDLADVWMEASAKAGTMELKLMQQYMPEELAIRIVGSEKGRPVRVSKAEIQGQFDLRVNFNVDSLNKELVKEKIELIKAGLELDSNATLDRNEAIAVVFDLIDPQLGERLIRPGGEATELEIKDEQDAFAKMFAGIPVDVKPGQAWQIRFEWLMNMIGQNATAQQRLRDDPNFKSLLERRVQQLQHQIQQFGANAQAGRTGAL